MYKHISITYDTRITQYHIHTHYYIILYAYYHTPTTSISMPLLINIL